MHQIVCRSGPHCGSLQRSPCPLYLGGLFLGGSVAEWSACWTQAQKPARVQITVATLSSNSLRQTVHTHCASVHQAAKLVAALLRVAGVTAGLAGSNGSLPPGLSHITSRLTAKNRDQLRNPTLGNRVRVIFLLLKGGKRGEGRRRGASRMGGGLRPLP